MMQQGVHQRAVLVAGGGVHHHAGGFVDDDQVIVFIQNIEVNVLWLRRCCPGGRKGYIEGRAGFDAGRGIAERRAALCRVRIINEPDASLCDQRLKAGAG